MSKALPLNTPQDILFLCTLNAVRSPMAEGLAKEHCKEGYNFYSAGIQTSQPDHFTTASMSEIGIDISEHLPKSILDFSENKFSQIICLSQESHLFLETLCDQHQAKGIFWDIPSPVDFANGNLKRDERIKDYNNIRDLIAQEIKNHF